MTARTMNLALEKIGYMVPGTCEEIEFGPVFNPVKY
jgi:hypothetical protein